MKPAHRTSIAVLLLAVLLLGVGCAPYVRHESAGRSAFGRGDYDAATLEACAALRYKPDHAPARLLLADAFRAASTGHLGRIGELERSSAKFRWDEIARHYEALVRINQAVSAVPAPQLSAGAPEPPVAVDYTAQLASANQRAAEEHYREGERLAGSAELGMQQQAFAEFELAQRFVPGFRDAAERAGRAKRAGMRRIAVLPFDNASGPSTSYGAQLLQITDRVTADIGADPQVTDFVELVSRDRLEQVMGEQQLQASGLVDPATAVRLGRLLGCHDILTGRITEILVTPAATRRTTSELEREVVDRVETYVDSFGIEQRREVKVKAKAVLNVFTKSATARMTGSYSVVNVGTAAVGNSGAFDGRREWSEQWGSYEGDKRALTPEQLSLCEKSEPEPPATQQLVTDAAADFAVKVASAARNYLR
jgi:hypothetical protein